MKSDAKVNKLLAYVCADAKLKDSAVRELHGWIRSAEVESFDMIDEYTAANFEGSRLIEHKKMFNKADLFVFLLESDVGSRIWGRLIKEYKISLKMHIPRLIVRYDSTASAAWKCLPDVIRNDKCVVEVSFCAGAVQAAIRNVLKDVL